MTPLLNIATAAVSFRHTAGGVHVEINGTIFVQVFILLMLLVWLSPVLFRPIMRLFEEREHRIVGAKIEAERLSVLAEQKALSFDLEYNKARSKARETLTALKQQADRAQLEIINSAKLEAQHKIQQADRDLVEQENRVRQELLKNTNQIADHMVQTLSAERV